MPLRSRCGGDRRAAGAPSMRPSLHFPPRQPNPARTPRRRSSRSNATISRLIAMPASDQGAGSSRTCWGLNGPDAATAAMGNFQTSPELINSRSTKDCAGIDAERGVSERTVAVGESDAEGRTDLRHRRNTDQEFTNYYNRPV